MSSANAFKLTKTKILSFGEELDIRVLVYFYVVELSKS